MMTYIQLLTVVLCSCFLQDAITSDVSVTVEPTKYPNLTRVSNEFWKSWEDINRASRLGKLGTRSVRNTVESVLNSPAFWSSLQRVINRRVRMTTDKEDANRQIRTYDIIADVLTNPAAIKGFQVMVADLYDSAIQYDPSLQQQYDTVAIQKALQTIFNAVNSGAVKNKVDMVKKYVDDKFNPSPEVLCDSFRAFKNSLNVGGMILINDSMATNILTTMSILEEIARSRKSALPIKSTTQTVKRIT
ncbi:Hypothetical protein CINCED_3A000175 [Cinara cedri]|nr:Hypothetical protein CINCED_3A000175 [Cinara cedri]